MKLKGGEFNYSKNTSATQKPLFISQKNGLSNFRLLHFCYIPKTEKQERSML
jgi:hypothetical protein